MLAFFLMLLVTLVLAVDPDIIIPPYEGSSIIEPDVTTKNYEADPCMDLCQKYDGGMICRTILCCSAESGCPSGEVVFGNENGIGHGGYVVY
jgi:hypothetical protein